MITIAIRHNFETAHRLPFLGGKCENLHGHSWWAEFDLANNDTDTGIDANGISVEFALAKRLIRNWIDEHLDHGTMLGTQDPLCNEFIYSPSDDGPGYLAYIMLGKVFLFGRPQNNEQLDTPVYHDLPWPTVEAVAKMLSDKIQELLDQEGLSVYVNSVTVKETHVNSATYYQGV